MLGLRVQSVSENKPQIASWIKTQHYKFMKLVVLTSNEKFDYFNKDCDPLFALTVYYGENMNK